MQFVFALLMFCSLPAASTPVNTIYLRTNCTENGASVSGCYTTLASLNSAIVTINPNASKPLLIDVGPGQFGGTFKCTNVSNITVRGSGRTNTVIGSYASGFPLAQMPAFKLTNCDRLDVSNLKAAGTYYVIDWKGAGTTTWTDVDVFGVGIGWYDNGTDSAGEVTCAAPLTTKHYWYSSKFEIHPQVSNLHTYSAGCGEHWFYGSELVASTEAVPGAPAPGNPHGASVLGAGNAEVHVYGSVLRFLAPQTGQEPNGIAIVYSSNNANVHIHGTGIDAESAFATNVTALLASTDGEIHANGTAYNLKSAGGIVTRVLKEDATAHIHAPYFWETHPEAPTVVSEPGYDTAVVTNTVDGFPHTVVNVLPTTCASGWYDTTIRACR
jgi:hypothetical protein